MCLYEHQKGASLNQILVLGKVRNASQALHPHNSAILRQRTRADEWLPLRLLCKIAIIQSSDYLPPWCALEEGKVKEVTSFSALCQCVIFRTCGVNCFSCVRNCGLSMCGVNLNKLHVGLLYYYICNVEAYVKQILTQSQRCSCVEMFRYITINQ